MAMMSLETILYLISTFGTRQQEKNPWEQKKEREKKLVGVFFGLFLIEITKKKHEWVVSVAVVSRDRRFSVRISRFQVSLQ